ncbi:MAG TPA: hypothetical protein VGG08_02995 [Solirubrobacteraceae bacterium]|jgi:hypothetical protein
MRATPTVAALAVVLLLATGCGKQNIDTGSEGLVGKSSALAFARAVNLRAGDLEGAPAGDAERDVSHTSAASARFARCAGGTDPQRRLINVRSVALRLPGAGASLAEFKSSVEVMPSAALAARTFAADSSSRGRACLSRLLPGVLGKTGARTKSISSLPAVKLANGQRGFGVRLVLALRQRSPTGQLVSLPVYLDVYELLQGPAEIGLTSSRTLRPPPSGVEHELLTLLSERAARNRALISRP